VKRLVGTIWADVTQFVNVFGPSGTRSSKPAPAPSQVQVQASKAPEAVIDAINSSIGFGLSIRNVYVARSEAHKKAYFIAGEFVGPGANGQVGVWLKTGEIDGPGMYFSVDGFADEFSVFPYARETAIKATIYDPPARQLKRFVQDQVKK